MEWLHSFSEYPNTFIMAIVFVFAFTTLVKDIKSVINAKISPIEMIIHEKLSLAKSSIDIDICVIAEKQNAENPTKNTRILLLLKVFFLKSIKNGNSFFSSLLIFTLTFCTSLSKLIAGLFILKNAYNTAKSMKKTVGRIIKEKASKR